MRSMVEGATPSAVRGLAPTASGGVRIGPGLALQPAACDRPPDRRRGSGISAEAEGTWQPAPLRRGPPAPSPVIVGMMRIIGADDAHHHRRFPHHRRGFAASSSGFLPRHVWAADEGG